MNRKDIVCAAIDRTGPPRTPINYCNRDFEHSDTIGWGFKAAREFIPPEPGLTEWGYVWHVLDQTMGQPGTHPLSEWERINEYVPPDPYAAGRFDGLEDFLGEWRDRFIKFSLGITGFNQASFLRGFETLLMDLYMAPERAATVLDIIFNFENGMIDQALRYPIDAIAFGDDWGTQEGLMIAPEVWRAVFRPRYAEQFARIHQAGKKVWFHSCGKVHAIINDLIEIGVDVIELLQPDIFGVERLAADFGGRVCFCCSVDHQRRAISGTRDEIFAYAKRLRNTLGAFNGGFIAYVEDYASLGMSEQNYQWIREAFHAVDAP